MANNAKIIYLLADVHLMPNSQHPINKKFFNFLENQAKQAQEIYLLGDLFESWVGDDLGLEEYATEIAALKKLTNSGIKTYLCYGNRDFLMRQEFWQATGIKQLEDITYRNLLGHKTILMHGDQLCTLDTGYQKMRKVFRNKIVQKIFLTLPKSLRRKIARKLRGNQQPQTTNNQTTNYNPKYDVNPQEVAKTFTDFRKHKCKTTNATEILGSTAQEEITQDSLQAETRVFRKIRNYVINKRLWCKVGLSNSPSCTTSTAQEEMVQDCPQAEVNLIHGHTHNPSSHPYPSNNHRWTVSDWDNTPQIIQITPEKIQLIKL